MSDDLKDRFESTLGQIKNYKQTYPSFSQPYSLISARLARDLNNQVVKDRLVQIQLAHFKSEWEFKIPPRLDEITRTSAICMSMNNDIFRHKSVSEACANLVTASASFRAIAQSAKSAIDDAEGAYQAELEGSYKIFK